MKIGQLKTHFNQMLDGLIQREFIKDTFGRYMSEEISESIIESGKIELGGEEVQASVLFCDIRGFTTLSESMNASEIVNLLNELFSHIVKPISQSGGVVNKYIGDCIMALFGVPKKNQEHPLCALKAALGMRKALLEFNSKQLEAGLPQVNLGIGIHTGPLVAGNIGAQERMEYTVIGDTVNVASRIESMTKEYACELLVSEELWNQIPDSFQETLKTEVITNATLKGKQKQLNLIKIIF
jgi:adenylate cyclase